MKRIVLIAAALLLGLAAPAKTVNLSKEFTEACDSLSARMLRRSGVKVELKLRTVTKRSSNLDFNFTETLRDYPWRAEDIDWFRGELKSLYPSAYAKLKVGKVLSNTIVALEDLPMPELSYDGSPVDRRFRVADPRGKVAPLVRRVGRPGAPLGLDGRTIALWQSHGLYLNRDRGEWTWQRPQLFQTVEDMYTQSYVLPFLVPMLENAGANVLLPRERDCSSEEVILQPLKVKGRTSDPTATWSGEVPAGQHALYVRYKAGSPRARYIVHHLGGKTEFQVNQAIGAGYWVYLGDFCFAPGNELRVEMYLDNKSHTYTAGPVKIGGGIGVSGRPRFVEGARYWMEYAGVDSTVWYQNCGKDDYRDDFMSRGAWVSWLSAGSAANPGNFIPPKDGNGKEPAERPGLKIPVDLSFGFHTDAGVTPNDSIVGTLAIYTLSCDNKTVFRNGENRMCQRQYADIVQTQIVNDLRTNFEPNWTRRQTWDRSYSESRTPAVPAMLLELLSHQNFADMKYGLDPAFRFTVSRAVYKGMLKYLSNRYGCDYIVQPLPVHNFSTAFTEEGVRLDWQPTRDPLEPTAQASGYLLYTRVDEGDFGEPVKADPGVVVPIEDGHLYSWKVVAYNDGGLSFPSEVLSAGRPEDPSAEEYTVVNCFTRVSGPATIDTPSYGGFDYTRDSGVPYIKDISFIGTQYEWDRGVDYASNSHPGFGASHGDFADVAVAGNTFDYPVQYGRAIMAAGHSFSSMSAKAFSAEGADSDGVFLIAGKQIGVFTPELQAAMRQTASGGTPLLVSGSYVASGLGETVGAAALACELLGWKPLRELTPRSALVLSQTRGRKCPYECTTEGFCYNNTPSADIYSVETVGALEPFSRNSRVIYSYSESSLPAAVCFEGPSARAVTFGFPLETVTDTEAFDDIISSTIHYFENR